MKTSRILMLALLVFGIFAYSCSSSSSDDGFIDEEEETQPAIVGKWHSPIAAPIFGENVDSIQAEFKSNKTYVVKSYKDGAAVELTGIYEISGEEGTIQEIHLEQNTPNSLTSEGIFQITGKKGEEEMKYEVAQTSPVQEGVTAPTVEGGFGSTSNGAFQDWNVQIYYRVKE